jgi:undecaprenyl-diphosphatase
VSRATAGRRSDERSARARRDGDGRAADTGQATGYVRHPGDVIRAALGAALLAACSLIAALEPVSGVETGLFHAVNALPSWLYGPLWLVMQLGSLGAVFAVAALAALLRRFRLALELLAAGLLAYYAAKGLKDLVGRGRPAALLNDVIVRGHEAPGLGFPSGHTAVAFALTATAVPFLARHWRRVIWVLPLTVGFARVFVGAHLPLDIVGGFALGYTAGALVHLVAGTPSRRVTPGQVQEALRRAGLDVTAVHPATVDARGSTPFFAETGDGATVFVKAVGADQRDADLLFKLWRSLAYQNLDDEKSFRSAKRQIEVEALHDLLAARAGVRTPDVVALSELHNGTTLLAHQGLRAAGLDTADAGRLSDAVLRDLWTQVALLHRARLAHRDLRLANVMLDEDGRSWVVDFGFAEASASDRALRRDVAELLASQSAKVSPGRVVAAAVSALGADEVAGALPYLSPAGLASATRTALAAQPGRLDELRRAIATATGGTAPRPVRFARVSRRALLAVIGAGVLLYAVPALVASDEIGQVLADASWVLLAPALAAYAATFPGAVEVLRGAAGRPIGWGRTLLVTVASSYANRASPPAMGRTALDSVYLQNTGLGAEEAERAVAAGSAAGAVVHLIVFVLVAIGVLVAPHSGRGALDTVGGVTAVLAVVILAFGLAWWQGDRQRRAVRLRRGAHGLREVLGSPARAARLFGGSAVVTLGYTTAFTAATLAVIPHTAGLGAALVYLAALPVASLFPVPGGVGVLDTLLVAGELLDGAGVVEAIVAVLLFRLITYWLVLVPGFFAYRHLTRRADAEQPEAA